MRRDRLNLQGGMTVETGRDTNGRFFIAHARSASVWIRCQRELRRFLRLKGSTTSRAALDSWLDSLQATDAERAEPSRAEVMATGFGPECHLDETDPNHNTRTVI
jgi:hypothetical protein